MSDQDDSNVTKRELPVELSQEWVDVARQFVMREMLLRKLSYEQLADLMLEQGVEGLTAERLQARIQRGNFSAGFLIRLFCAMGCNVLDLSSLRKQREETKNE